MILILIFIDFNIWESHDEDDSTFTKDKNTLLNYFLLFIDIVYVEKNSIIVAYKA